MGRKRFRFLFIIRRLADKARDYSTDIDEAIDEAIEQIKKLRDER